MQDLKMFMDFLFLIQRWASIRSLFYLLFGFQSSFAINGTCSPGFDCTQVCNQNKTNAVIIPCGAGNWSFLFWLMQMVKVFSAIWVQLPSIVLKGFIVQLHCNNSSVLMKATVLWAPTSQEVILHYIKFMIKACPNGASCGANQKRYFLWVFFLIILFCFTYFVGTLTLYSHIHLTHGTDMTLWWTNSIKKIKNS